MHPMQGKYNAERTVALVGSQIEAPRYLKTRIGSEVASMIYDRGIHKDAHARIISRNSISNKGFKHYKRPLLLLALILHHLCKTMLH